MRIPPTRIDTDADRSTDARLCRIVRLLSDNATVVISGTRIAEELGTSRSEVWRAVQHLRDSACRSPAIWPPDINWKPFPICFFPTS